MLLQYNSISLEIEHFNSFQQRAVYSEDDTTYLYTHFLIDVTCVFNPTATSTLQQGYRPISQRADKNNRGDKPSVSMPLIRRKLLEPTKLLIIQIGDYNGWQLQPANDLNPPQSPFTLLESPQVAQIGGYAKHLPCDARGGPRPISCDVTAIHGDESFIVRYQIETWLVECDYPNIIMSHRWEMAHDIDEHYYTTRTITGSVVFRKDLIDNTFDPNFAGQLDLTKPWPPDFFRGQFFFPVPNTFKRTAANVRQDPDGTTVRYSVTDEEQTLVVSPYSGITKIAGKWRRSYDTYGGTLSTPKQSFEVNIDVWGNRLVTRNNLVKAALRAAAAWNMAVMATSLRDSTGASIASSPGFVLEVDMVDRHVSLASFVEVGAFIGLVGFLTQGSGMTPDKGPINGGFPESLGDLAIFGMNTPGQTMPGDGGIRGTYLESLISAALKTGICAKLATPTSFMTSRPSTLNIPTSTGQTS